MRILYFYTRNATFIEKDLEMMRSHFAVLECPFPAPEKWKLPLMFLKQFIFLFRHSFTSEKSLVMSQFAGYHSFLPCLWGRIIGWNSIVVAGGTDCVSFPSLGYGHFRNPLLAIFTRWTFKLCHVVSAVHDSLFYRENPYAGLAESKQGILHFMPEARFEKNVIFNGFDEKIFRISDDSRQRKPMSFISIASSLTDPVRMKLKGIDMVLELALKLPNANFTLIGADNPDVKIPSNVRLLPFIPNSELPDIYNNHQFYLQLSMSEGFPNALCEAMACGCIPIVSEVASMPEIVAGMGGIAAERNLDSILKATEEAIEKSIDAELPMRISTSIFQRFSWEKRKENLITLISKTAQNL